MTERAAIVGASEHPARRLSDLASQRGSLPVCADLALMALEDAGLALHDVDGLYVAGVHESPTFMPSTAAEYLGLAVDHAGSVDLGGATPAAMAARAAMAIAMGEARVVLCMTPGVPPPRQPGVVSEDARFGASSYRPGSPQAEFDIPLGHVGQNALYAMVAQRYAATYDYDPAALARLVAHLRENGARNPDAIFSGKPVTAEDVLASRMIADPIRMLEIVMPVAGGAAFIVTDEATAARCRRRPAFIAGWGERLATKSPQYVPDLLAPPMISAAQRAFGRAELTPADIDVVQLYDCYAINVMLTLEAAGFCARGEGMAFLREHDMRISGDFPLNTNGGQLGFGQAGHAGGATHIVEAFRQIAGLAGDRQVTSCDSAFVSGNGGIMSEQVALVLRGG